MKKQEAFGQINAMSGVVKLIDIINIVKSIDNFKEDTLDVQVLGLRQAQAVKVYDRSGWQ